MLHLALKAFHPGEAAVSAAARRHDVEVPRDVRVPRPDRAPSSGSSCSSTSTRRACEQGINPFTHGSSVHTDVMKTEGAQAGARRSTASTRVRRRAPRRGEVARQGAHLLVPLGAAPLGSEEPAPGAVAPLQRAQAAAARRSACSRCRTGPSSTSGNTSTASSIPIVPLYFAAERPVVERDGTLIMVDDERMPLAPGEKPQMRKRALPHARLLSADRRGRERRRHAPAIIQEMLLAAHVRAPGPRDRPRRERPRWRRRSRRGTSDGPRRLHRRGHRRAI